MLIIILLLLIITYNISGIYAILQLIIAIINIFIINILLEFEHDLYFITFLRFIRICSFIYIIVITLNNIL